jgi:hypothetical protein
VWKVVISVKLEKKLVAYSAIALLIGIASISPLMFLMSAKAEATSKPWFNIDVPYAYLTTNSSKNPNFHLGENASGFWHSILLNITVTPDAWNDLVYARFEYFQIQFYSDAGSILNETYFVGGNRTSSANPLSLDWFETFISLSINISSIGTIVQYSNSGDSRMGMMDGGWLPQNVSDIRSANALYVDVSRMSYVTFGSNSTVIELANNEVIQHIELKKLGDGFLYNTLLPEDQLSQIT